MMEDAIEAEIKQGLPDDMILWIGKPDPARFVRAEVSQTLRPLLAGATGIILFLIIDMYFFRTDQDFIVHIGLPIILVPVILWTLYEFIRSSIMAHRTVYVVTDKHLVFLTRPLLWSSRSVHYYTPDKIAYLKCTSDKNGTGNLEFRRDAHYVRTKRIRRREVSYRKVGFWGIANVKMVEDTICYQFHIQ